MRPIGLLLNNLAMGRRSGEIQTYIDKVLSYNPIAFWPLSEEVGYTIKDLSVTNSDGILGFVRLAQISGPDGNPALQIVPDDGNALINGFSAALASVYSAAEGGMMIWVKPRTATVWDDGVVRRFMRALSGTDGHLIFKDSVGSPDHVSALRRAESVNAQVSFSPTPPADTAWRCILMDWSDSENRIRLWIDGAGPAVGVSDKTISSALTAVYLGMFAPGTATWDGYLALAALFTGEFTPEMVADLSTPIVTGSFSAPPVHNPNRFVAATTYTLPLTTPTYDGSGQVVHPDVLYFGEAWNGYHYWMAMTPYPSSNADYENPSLLVSSDGLTWEVPPGVTNPVVAKPDNAYNSDPDIIVVGSTMYLYWREFRGGVYDRIKCKSTDDGGVTWSAETTLFDTVSNASLSPAVIYNGTQYIMYLVDHSGTSRKIIRRTCATPAGTWSDPEDVSVTVKSGETFDPWHVDAYYDANESVYYLLVDVYGSGGSYLLAGTDGASFVVGEESLTPFVTGDMAYRSSLIRTATGWDIWWSTQTIATNTWRCGFIQATERW